MRDKRLMTIKYLTDAIDKENQRQIKLWGIQEHPVYEWLSTTMEEIGEFIKAINDLENKRGCAKDVIKEGIQSATLLLKMIEMIAMEYHIGYTESS